MTSSRKTLLIGASGGVGNGFLQALTARGDAVTTLSRSRDGFDVSVPATIETAAGKLKSEGAVFSQIIVATGVLDITRESGDVQGPEKAFRDLAEDNAMRAFQVNALGPALIFKHFAKLLPAKDRGDFVALSARVGSIGDNNLGGWMSYRASKAALNQFIRCASIEHQRQRPNHLVIAMHPGTIPTALTEKYAKGRYTDDPIDAASRILTTIDALTAEDSGGFYAYDGSVIEW